MQRSEDQQAMACSLTNEHVISDFATAQRVSQLMLEFSKQLEFPAELVRDACSEDEWKVYKKAAASIYFEMFLGVA